MGIALLNQKITFQKNTVTVDEIGNHKNVWVDYYSCHATVSGEGGSEKSEAGLTVDDSDLSFSVRFCKAVAEATTDGFRIVFGSGIYNIINIDHKNYKNKAMKFKCQKARR